MAYGSKSAKKILITVNKVKCQKIHIPRIQKTFTVAICKQTIEIIHQCQWKSLLLDSNKLILVSNKLILVLKKLIDDMFSLTISKTIKDINGLHLMSRKREIKLKKCRFFKHPRKTQVKNIKISLNARKWRQIFTLMKGNCNSSIDNVRKWIKPRLKKLSKYCLSWN